MEMEKPGPTTSPEIFTKWKHLSWTLSRVPLCVSSLPSPSEPFFNLPRLLSENQAFSVFHLKSTS